ncbi:MAG: NGG1p interacting factor NIF3 [Patescibacteria group bacterium]|jgi:putative NIF3 family GTP cyclohydrolase 1 type 2
MMTIRNIYDLAIRLGTQHDLRGVPAVKRVLWREKKRYDAMTSEQKKEYDTEHLTNPFADTRFYTDTPNLPVKRIMAGIDIDTEEVLLAKALSEQGPKIDLILAHHPIGTALAGLHEVMHMQAEVMAVYGVPINIAESLMHVRMDEVSRSVSPVNHNRAVDAAKLLGFPLMCTHTATDNLVADFLKKLLDRNKKNIDTVGDVIHILKGVPEYQQGQALKSGISLYAGSEQRLAGKIALTEVTGGTEGSKHMYEKLSQAGVGTIIGMHMKEDHKREAEKHHISVIIAGHMSSDSLGMNLFLDELEKKGIEIIPCSGLIRVKRFTARKKKARKK